MFGSKSADGKNLAIFRSKLTNIWVKLYGYLGHWCGDVFESKSTNIWVKI